MKKWIKILIAIIVTPIVLFIILIEPFQVGHIKAENKILIASQGSEFKNNLVENLVGQLNGTQNYFSIIDCTALGNEDEDNWDAVIIIHTMQIHHMPEEAKTFLSEVVDISKVLLVSTSGGGDDVVEDFNVDAISSASRIVAIPDITRWIIEKLKEKLEDKIASK